MTNVENVRAPISRRIALIAFTALGAIFATLMPAHGRAATHVYEVLIDSDGSAATGCTASNSAGAAAGVEIIARATVITTQFSANVTTLERLNCQGGSTFGAASALPGAPYTLSMGYGGGGSTAIEMGLPLAAIPANADPTLPTIVRVGARSLAANGAADALLPLAPLLVFAAPLAASDNVSVPTLHWSAVIGLALILYALGIRQIRRNGMAALRGNALALFGVALGGTLLIAGGGLAYAITKDGGVVDWDGTSALIAGTVGNVGPNADLRALYAKVEGGELALRIDVDLALEPVAGNSAPLVSAGPNQTVTLNAGGTALASLVGSISDDGLPNPPGALVVAWSKVSGPGTVVFTNAAIAGTSATINQAGSYVLRLTATDSLLSSSADVTVTVNPFAGGNQAPVITGLPASIGLTLPANSTSLTPTVTDDGLPNPPAALTYAWTRVSGGTVTFSAASSKDTSATFATAGTYVLRLSVSDSLLSTTRDISVNVNAAGAVNQLPVVSAGANQSITLPALATLAGSATDDGLPSPPAQLTTTWSMVSGPAAGVAFTNPASPTTKATFAAPGTYVLRLTAGDGALSATSDTQVTVTDGAPLLLSIPDRTISLGTRYQQLLVASDGNVNDSLTYTLVTSPTGAALNPSPLVDWVPTAGQLGAHTFTAKVVDALGHTATTSFTVTVVHTNQPPQLATQTNVILPIGTSFNRVLQGRDPDAGDALTYTLVSGPPGMALSGATLDWSTLGRPTGDYLVTVRVTDGGGLFDSKQFTVTLTPSAPGPTAKDDSYTVRLGETLTVAAPGVLTNDISPGGRSLTALKITDPTKGTLNGFNANGGFSYTAPATLPPRALNPVVSFRGINGGSTVFQYAADFDRDGKADYVSSDFGNFRAWRGSDGAQLWQFDPNIATNVDLTGCTFFAFFGSEFALGDVRENGEIDLIMPVQCTKDIAGGGTTDRLVAVNVSSISPTGKVAARWLSPRLSQPHPGAYESPAGSPLPNPPAYPGSVGSAYRTLPTLAKIAPAGSTKILLRKLWTSTEGYYFASSALGTYTYAACRTATGLVADEGRPCKATYVLDAGTGAVENVLVAPNNADERQIDNGPTTNSPPIVADLDGDGQVEIISGGDVWKLVNGSWTLAWQAMFESNAGIPRAYEPDSVAVADLDGDGKAEVIMHMLPTSNSGVQIQGWIYIFSHDGTLQRRIPFENGLAGMVSVADVDGDGAPEILLTFSGVLYVYRGDGSLLWAKELSDDVTGVTPVINQLQPASRSNNSPVYVYDLDLDGVPEVIVQGSRRLFILNGRTSAEIWSIDTEAEGYANNATPMLVDADGDGHIDIVLNNRSRWNCSVLTGGPVDCKGGTFKISGGDLNWAPGPKVQNQMNFRASAINDSAVIRYDASMRRDFRQQIQQGTVIDPRVSQGTSFTYKANDGTLDSAPATVQIDIKPVNRPPVITSIPPTAFTETAPTGTFQTVYTITAVDPDPGDSVHYEFVATQGRQFAPPTVDPVTGAVNVTVCGAACGGRLVTIVVAAIDSFGARTEQSMIINMTPTTATVPNVVGQTIVAARALLEPVPLTPLVASEVFNSAAAGIVLAQDPLAGASGIAQNATVRLTVSKGPKPTLVPFVVGDTLSVANAKLAALGFSRAVAPVFSTTIPVNQVMSQTPNGGTELLPIPANPVSLTVSAGPPLPLPIASIVVEPGPGPLQRLAGDELQFKATAVFTDGTSADITLTSAWASTTASTATVSTTGLAKAIGNGSTTISATMGGRTGSVTLNVAARTLGDNTPPTAAITAPTDGAAITGPTTIVGTASDTNFLRYELAIALAGDETFSVIAEGTTAVNNGTLGTLDPTTMVNDLYTLRLTVFDRSENVTVVTSTVQLKGNRKVGLFTLTYQDLNVPAAGIPLTVHRTYDSRDKTKGDFGIGWRLGLQTLRIRTNRALGTGWVRNVAGVNVSLAPTSGHWVSVTLPDGRVEEFDMVVSPTSNVGSLDATNVTGFAPRAGTLGRLEALGNNSLLIISGGATFELVDDTTLNTYSPKLYRYTTQDGTQIEISPAAGVKKVTDRNGNAVTFGPGGILHSDGRGIVFKRDAKDRIVSITDLMGNVQNYTYDGNGDLVTHTNAVGAASTYSYDRNHGLIGISDPIGNQAVRNEYDTAGRLISTTDAAGKAITFTHNVAADEEIVTNRLGKFARILYDATGNVTRQERTVTIEGTSVLAVTTSTYDALGNETSTVDPDGQRIDATFSAALPTSRRIDPTGVNLTTAFTYNAAADVTGVTDPGGRIFGFTVNGTGNLTAATVPGFGSSTATNNTQGLPIERTDALGTRTDLGYDTFGRVIREEVFAGTTLLRRVDTDWDVNGNKTGQTLHRTIDGVPTTVSTRYAYDAANRMTAITDAMGGVRRMEYDAVGRVTAEIDPLGGRTVHTYDTLGQRTRTTYPDGAFATLTYDVEGNVTSATDRGGRTTLYAYDELGRLVRTTAPDGTVTQTIYTVGGRIAATIDARGNRTDFTYDTAGRLLSTTLPAVPNGPGGPLVRPQASQALNSLSLPVSRTDPNGRVTTFQFDAEGRLTRTTRPDGSSVQLTWDVLGRRTTLTNEEGQTTTYGYDGLGRLTSVGGYAGTMNYAYDEAGNLVSQTDALGRITRFRYDLLSRLVERRYPGGEVERWAYDAKSNLVSRIDGLGRTTTWSYDVLNRPTAKMLPGGVTVSSTYRPDGQRASVTDTRGTTTFSYDSAGRLASVTHPTNEVVSYTYDANGNLASLTTPAATQEYMYDALDRITQVTAPEGITSGAYDLVGNRVRRTGSNGITTDAAYDNRNRPTLLSHKLGATVLQSYATTWSLANRRTGVTEQDGSAERYVYDSRGRLTGETRTGTGSFAISVSYDAVGNRTGIVRDGTPTLFTYDVNDRVIADGAATYAWDANGNLVSRTQGANTTNYGYDPQDRLVAVGGPGLANQYVFDADGNRVGVSTASSTTRLLVDTRNNTGLSQVLEERDGAGNLAARYTVDTTRLAMVRGGTARIMLTDPAGSVRALSDATGAITDQYRYDAYGNTLSTSGTTVNPYRWRGERFEESGLVDLRARFYSPGQGMFLARDPLMGRTEAPASRHRYLYASADPVNNVDPTGMSTLAEVSFTQAINSMLDYSYLVDLGQKACTAKTGAESIGALSSGISQFLGIGFLLAQGVIIGNEVLNPHKPGKGGSFDFNFKSDDKGWLPINTGLRAKAGQYAGYFSIKYQDPGQKGSVKNYGKFEFSLAGPPATFNVSGGGGVERTLKEFRYCGTGGPKVGSVKVKGELMGSGSIQGNDGSVNGAIGLTTALEMSLFYDAVKFSWPLITVSEGTKGLKATLFGLVDLFNIEALPN